VLNFIYFRTRAGGRGGAGGAVWWWWEYMMFLVCFQGSKFKSALAMEGGVLLNDSHISE